MKPIVSTILRGAGGVLVGIIEGIIRRREGKRQKTAREVLADAPTSTIPAARAKAEHALRESQRRHRDIGLPEVDEAVREMLAETRRDGGR